MPFGVETEFTSGAGVIPTFDSLGVYQLITKALQINVCDLIQSERHQLAKRVVAERWRQGEKSLRCRDDRDSLY